MSPTFQKYERPLASLFASACSFCLWMLVGMLRWEDRPWNFIPFMSPTERSQVFGTMWWLDFSSKVLGAIAIAWAIMARKKSYRWLTTVALVIAILAFLVSWVP